VNVGRIQKAIEEKRLDASVKITQEVLEKAGVARARKDGIRLLGTGTLKAKLDIEVAGASKGAREAVEKAGGTLVVTFKKKVYLNKKGTPGKRQERRAKSAEKRAARAAEA
jgi:large subunit ribosomal protein L15